VLMGKQAIDDDSNQVGQMLAALLGVGQATFVSKLELLDNNTRARCARETDAGIETVTVSLPAVITTDLRLNEPRYVSLPGIMKAKKKPIEEFTLTDLGVTAASRTTVLKLESPPKRKAGIRVKSVDELVDKLRNEAKVI
jgi:electron transfer flavoprotein beta subunit